MSSAEQLIQVIERTTYSKEFGIIVPTHNAAGYWASLDAALRLQSFPPDQVLIVDSSSSDDTPALARKSGYRLVTIPQEEFDHGATRRLACTYMPDAEYLLFLTQDAILDKPDSARKLFDTLLDPSVGAAFGRQLPRPQADAIEAHARLFNYPDRSHTRTIDSRHELGIKAAFFSNSFAVYRRRALEEVGGFPSRVILGEDFHVAAKMLMAGWKVIYQSDATVIHSHPLTVAQEFKRYFSIGVHHSREVWMLDTFGSPKSEGFRFVQSEVRYLKGISPRLIPLALLRTFSKLVAYRLGRLESHMPIQVKQKLSGNATFWNGEPRQHSMTASPASFETPVTYTQGPQAKNVLPQHVHAPSARH